MFKSQTNNLLVLLFVSCFFSATSLRIASTPSSHETVQYHLQTDPGLAAPINQQRDYLLAMLNAMRA